MAELAQDMRRDRATAALLRVPVGPDSALGRTPGRDGPAMTRVLGNRMIEHLLDADPDNVRAAPVRAEAPPETAQVSAQWASKGGVHLPGWTLGARAPDHVRELTERPGEQIPRSLIDHLAGGLATAAPVTVHHDERSDRSTRALGADAYTAGSHIAMRQNSYPPRTPRDRQVLAHELGHVAQAFSVGIKADLTMREDARAEASADDHEMPLGIPPGVRRHPITKIGKWTLKRLGREGTKKYISKHVAKHMRRNLERPIHTVFKQPRAVKDLVTRTVREAVELGERRAAAAAESVLEEGALRISRQVKAPGKFRFVIQKEFAQAIGTKGERVLQIFLDQSGRIVTAYPTNGFRALGLTTAGAATLGTQTANAAEATRESYEREAKLHDAYQNASQHEDSWVDWIPIIGDLHGGSLNAGESYSIAAHQESPARSQSLERTVHAVVRSVEEDLQRSLGPDEVKELREEVLMIVMSGMDIEGDEQDMRVGQEASP